MVDFKAGQRVTTTRVSGEFIVLRIDREAQTAELLQLSGIRRVVNAVPLKELRAVEMETAEADEATG